MNISKLPRIFAVAMKKEIFLKNLGERIRDLRIEKGISQAQLARSIGKRQQSIQRLESGKFNPTVKYLLAVAKGMELSMKKLLETL